MTSSCLTVAVQGRARRKLDAAAIARLRRRFARALAATGLPRLELSIVLTDDVEIRSLNRRYRRRDKATDVLSFSLQEGRQLASGETRMALGDIVISVEAAARVRHEPGLDLEGEILFLFTHGLCHLLGYDHRTDREEAEMNERADALRAAALGGTPFRRTKLSQPRPL